MVRGRAGTSCEDDLSVESCDGEGPKRIVIPRGMLLLIIVTVRGPAGIRQQCHTKEILLLRAITVRGPLGIRH